MNVITSKINIKRVVYSFKWGASIGFFTGVLAVLGTFDTFLKQFDFQILGGSFYLLKIIPMFFVIAFFRDKNILDTFLTGFLSSVFISLISEITIHGYYIISLPKHDIVFWIFFQNLIILTIASAIIAFVLDKYGNKNSSVLKNEKSSNTEDLNINNDVLDN